MVSMSQYFRIHPENPQGRLIEHAVQTLRNGGVIAYPTDSAYALGCHIGDKAALNRLYKIRNLDKEHNFTLICRNLSEVSIYARFDTPVYRLLKANTPGPYTFILRATKEVPRRLMHVKKKTIGFRIPDHPIVQHILEELNEPILTTTLILPGEEYAINDPNEIRNHLDNLIDLIIDGGPCGTVPTTVVDLLEKTPRIMRIGKGDIGSF